MGVRLERTSKLHPHPNRQKHLYPRAADLNGLWHKRARRNRIQQLDLCVALPRARHVLIYFILDQRQAFLDKEQLSAQENVAFVGWDRKLIWLGADLVGMGKSEFEEETERWKVCSRVYAEEWEWDGMDGRYVMKDEARRKREVEDQKKVDNWRDGSKWVERELERIGWGTRAAVGGVEEGESSKNGNGNGNGSAVKRRSSSEGDPAFGELALLRLDDDADDEKEDDQEGMSSVKRGKQKVKKQSGNLSQALAATLRKKKGR